MTKDFLEDLIRRVTVNDNRLYKHYLFVAEKKGRVAGAAIASQFLDQNFLYLDYLASSKENPSRGIGAALYSRVKEQALLNQSKGLFLECDSIEREFCISDEEQKQNKIRLNFYQKFGARQLMNSLYEEPRASKHSMHLLFDNIQNKNLDLKALEKIVTAILSSHRDKVCSKTYIKKVVGSLGKARFESLNRHRPQSKSSKKADKPRKEIPSDQKISLTLNLLHKIHHVREKGYVESPIRIDTILNELTKLRAFEFVHTKKFPDSAITEVHDPDYYSFLKKICEFAGNKTIYPDVFPIRNRARMPKDLEAKAGYYCMDTYSPINRNAFLASRAAVNCALTAASCLIGGDNIAYSLVRPPGHHAEKRFFGGFCYLNSTAIAANFLSKHGRVAILDVDYHHGNGQQNIFYKRDDVFTASIHGHPEFAYPHFTGFEEERGEDQGFGFNANYPLPMTLDGPSYRKTLQRAINKVKEFDPVYLLVALGLDTAKGDPTGTWKLLAKDFEENGLLIGALKKPTLIIQEGGYRTQVLGVNARNFFHGLMTAYYKS